VLHDDRSRAESFGSIAALYDRARPSYPPALVDDLVADEPRAALDVGCGTGIAGALLAARGAEVLGVEIDERMAALARGRGLRVEIDAFERWEPAGRTFDLLISAQSWHWIEPVTGAAKAATALRPAGRACLFWNLGDPPAEMRERLAPVYERFAPELESYSIVLGGGHDTIEAAAAGINASGRFEAAQVRRFPWTEHYTTASWLEYLSSHSDHQAMAPARLERLLDAVGETLAALGGSFELAFEAVLVDARRR
jgi:SAM-dependent methyltransferase